MIPGLSYLENRFLTQAAQNERIQEMVELLKETSALREPILKIQSTVEETKVGVEETKRTVKNIFESIEG